MGPSKRMIPGTVAPESVQEASHKGTVRQLTEKLGPHLYDFVPIGCWEIVDGARIPGFNLDYLKKKIEEEKERKFFYSSQGWGWSSVEQADLESLIQIMRIYVDYVGTLNNMLTFYMGKVVPSPSEVGSQRNGERLNKLVRLEMVDTPFVNCTLDEIKEKNTQCTGDLFDYVSKIMFITMKRRIDRADWSEKTVEGILIPSLKQLYGLFDDNDEEEIETGLKFSHSGPSDKGLYETDLISFSKELSLELKKNKSDFIRGALSQAATFWIYPAFGKGTPGDVSLKKVAALNVNDDGMAILGLGYLNYEAGPMTTDSVPILLRYITQTMDLNDHDGVKECLSSIFWHIRRKFHS